MTRAARIMAGTIAAAIALGACGSNGEGVSTAARNRLTPLIDQVRQRAAAHDAAGAEHSLATLRQDVARLEQQGEIGHDDATAIVRAAAVVENRLTLITTTTTTTTTLPEPKNEDKGDKGHGRKRGHHKDDENGG